MPLTLTVDGDCLAPDVKPGDHLVLSDRRPLAVGALVAAELACGTVLVGEAARWSGSWWLTNPRHVPVRLDDAVRVLGVVEAIGRALYPL